MFKRFFGALSQIPPWSRACLQPEKLLSSPLYVERQYFYKYQEVNWWKKKTISKVRTIWDILPFGIKLKRKLLNNKNDEIQRNPKPIFLRTLKAIQSDIQSSPTGD